MTPTPSIDPTPTPSATPDPTVGPTPTPEPTTGVDGSPAPSASASPVPPASIEADRDFVLPGGTVEVCGEGWLPGSEVEITIDGETVVATVTVSDDGTFCTLVVVPAGTVEGAYDLVATGLDTAGEPTAQVQGIQVGLPATDAGARPSTPAGQGSPVLVLLALACLAAAALTVRPVARR